MKRSILIVAIVMLTALTAFGQDLAQIYKNDILLFYRHSFQFNVA